MIRLSNTTKKLQAVLAGAITTSQPQAVVSFFDENVQGEDTRGADQETNLNSTTDVDICNALGTGKEGYTRNIDTLTIYNRDTVSATVTVKIDDGGTETVLVRAALATLETLAYDHESGWRVTGADGSLKTSLATFPVASDTVQGIIEIAVQSEMETGTDVTRAVTPGRQHYHPSAAKAWGTASGDGSSLLASYNVTSITDNGTGDITFTYTTAFSSANYSAIIVSEQPATGAWCYPYTHTTTAIRALNLNAAGTQSDPTNPYSFVAFGDQ